MMNPSINILSDLLTKEGDKAILSAKYMNMSPEEIMLAYDKAGLNSPIMVVKNTWLPMGFSEHGWGNGYVLIPEGHKYYGLDYDEIPVNVHGGLTFAEHIKDDDRGNFSDGFWVGFDTAHHNDNMTNWPKSRVLEETIDLFKQIYGL